MEVHLETSQPTRDTVRSESLNLCQLFFCTVSSLLLLLPQVKKDSANI